MSEFKTTERDITSSIRKVTQTVSGITLTFKDAGESFSFVPASRYETAMLELEVVKTRLATAVAKIEGIRSIVRLGT